MQIAYGTERRNNQNPHLDVNVGPIQEVFCFHM